MLWPWHLATREKIWIIWIRTKTSIVYQDRERQSPGLGDSAARSCVKRALEMYKGSYDRGESKSLRGCPR